MTPILYTSTTSTFANNGVGLLSDAVSCVVAEERNGAFELTMEYPVSGIHYSDITARAIIVAKPNPTAEAQPFRVYRTEKPIGGVITVYAEHISYDLTGIPVSRFTASSLAAALTGLKTNAATNCPFTFWTDKVVASSFSVEAPSSMRSLLGGTQGSILDTYGGEYEFDRYTVRLWGSRGADRGVQIRYGKNLTDLTQEENIQSTYTGIYPYFFSDVDGSYIELPEKILSVGTYNYSRVLTVDFSGDFESAPTVDQLRARAQSYISANHIGVPRVSLSVSFVQFEQTEEYKELALLERVSLCDTVSVEFADLGVSASAKVVRTEYDVLLDRYVTVEIGDARSTIADTIAAQSEEIKDLPDSTEIQRAATRATALITGNLGGYVVIHSSTGSSQPDEILIMDTPDISTATKVWRWNSGGLGYSSTGYNGPYGLAMTIDGSIVANFITSGALLANVITAGILQSNDGSTFVLDLEGGSLSMKDATIQAVNVTVYKRSDYSSADVSRLQGILLGSVFPSDEDFEKYSFYGSGRLSVRDLVILTQLVNGAYGAELTLTTTLFMSKSKSEIVKIKAETSAGVQTEGFRVFGNGMYSTDAYIDTLFVKNEGNAEVYTAVGRSNLVGAKAAQAGTVSLAGNGATPVTFSDSFDTPPCVVATWNAASASALGIINVTNVTTSGFIISVKGSDPIDAQSIMWVAVAK